MVRLTGDDRPQVLDDETKVALDAELANTGALASPDLNGILVAGMMTYMTDVAMIEECLSGRQFPIAQEGACLALEQAILANQNRPGIPLYMTIESGISMRESMEGPAQQKLCSSASRSRL
jgi:hypothetical protein